MKDELLKWVNGQRDLDVTSKFILYRLAQFADGECCAWAPVKVLAEATNASERTVQYRLRALADAGLIAPTGRSHRMKNSTRSVPVYQLAPGEAWAVLGVSASAAAPEETAPSMGANSAPIDPEEAAHGCKNEGGMGATACTRKEPIGTEIVRSDDLTQGAGARAAGIDPLSGFEEGWAAYPDAGRKGASSPRLGREAWANELAEGTDPDRLVAACRAMGADRAHWGVSGRPVAFHRFIAEGRWEGLDAPAAPAAEGLGDRTPFGPPPEVRALAAPRLTAAQMASYVDPCGWRGEDRTLLARTSIAADWLRRNLGDVLREAGVNLLIEPRERVA